MDGGGEKVTVNKTAYLACAGSGGTVPLSNPDILLYMRSSTKRQPRFVRCRTSEPVRLSERQECANVLEIFKARGGLGAVLFKYRFKILQKSFLNFLNFS